MAKSKAARSQVQAKPVRKPNELRRTLAKGQTPAEDTARVMVEGLAQNMLVMQLHSSMLPETDATEAFALTLAVTERVTRGDRVPLEAILAAQAIACNSIFTDCVKRARQNYERLEVHDRLMKIGLRAQSQCRATVESIALMQSPPTIFANQANVTSGAQQINNGTAPASVPSRARELKTVPNKLLEAKVERMDTGTPHAAGNRNQEVATVGAIDRAQDGGR